MTQIADQIQPGPQQMLYNAQVKTIAVVTIAAGGCLLLTSVIMLLFYIKHYIDVRKKELGILKAFGYSNLKIAINFWVFGINILLGTLLGLGGGYALAPLFYKFNNNGNLLPDVVLHFHPEMLLYMVVIPSVSFGILAVFYAAWQLRAPVNALLWEPPVVTGKRHRKDSHSDKPFLQDLRRSSLRSRKVLLFFIIFASFCFSCNTQMSFSMVELASEMMGVMVMILGLILAFTTLFIAITTVIAGNQKTIAIMRTFGYSQNECTRALLGCYRPMAYIGFVLGTVYQYGLLRMMVDIIFADMEGVPEYRFDWSAFWLSLIIFVLFYEILMYVCSEKVKKISIKEIMME